MSQIETSEFLAAIKQICAERNLPEERVFEVVEAALGAAYRKEYLSPETKVNCELDRKTLKPRYYQILEVVKEVEHPQIQISLKEAKKISKDVKIGDTIKIKLPPKNVFSRISAQTAKQVITQRIREIEKEETIQEFQNKLGKVVNGVIQQIEGNSILVDLGKAVGILPPPEQNPTEEYGVGKRIKVLIKAVEPTSKGASILVSRAAPQLVEALFRLEVPEISAGVVNIKNIVREAGYRTKIAVETQEEGVDPVGACVGQRGARVQTILNEIGGEEKIDIILWDKDPKKYITNALSPAKIKEIKIDEKAKKAEVLVDKDQLSLAIGKQGRNVRLASKLTGYEIDIFSKEREKEKIKEESQKPSDKTKQSKNTENKSQ